MKIRLVALRNLLVIVTLLLQGWAIAPAQAKTTDTTQHAQASQRAERSSSSTPPAGLSAPDWAFIQDQIRTAQYQVTWQTLDSQSPAYRAPNPAQGFDVAFALTGFTAQGMIDDMAWHFAFRPVQYGDALFPTALAPDALLADQDAVTYEWQSNVHEWYHNQPQGVEHGFTLYAPPNMESSHIALTLALDTNLEPALSAEGQVLTLRVPGRAGPVILRYDTLRVTDARGRPLPAHFALARRGHAHTLSLIIETVAAVYPLTVDPLLHTQIASLHASDMQAIDLFGFAVSISGDTLVVGAPYEDGGVGDPAVDAGAAYVFTRNTGGTNNWGEAKILRASDMQEDDNFGWSVSTSGDTVVVGAFAEDGDVGNPTYGAGAVYVFTRNAGGADNWGQVQILHASDMQAFDFFGIVVCVSGDVLVVGAPHEDGGAGDAATDAGAAYVFTRNTGGADNWGQVKILHASDMQASDYFGNAISVSGDTLVAGAFAENGGVGNPTYGAGAAYVFTRNTGGLDNWGQVQILHASDMQAGDYFGNALSVSGDTVVVGASLEGGGVGNPAVAAGAAYVFTRNAGGVDNWGEVKILHASDMQASDYFGYTVSVSGDTLVAGAPAEDGGAGDPATDAGAAYVFTRNTGGLDNWGQVQILHASDMQAGDSFGYSASVSGSTLVVSARDEDGGAGNPAEFTGAAYVFDVIPTYTITPTTGANGSITPGTPQTVNHGDSITFTIAADANYHIADVGVDGASVGAVGSYTFNNVTATHTLTAAFAINRYILTVATAGTGSGSVTPTMGVYTYTHGTSVPITATADIGSAFIGWSGACSGAGLCDIPMTSNQTVTATFDIALWRYWLPILLR